MNINGMGSGGSSTDYSRITGLATGMDIDGMVKNMLARDRARMDKVTQDRQYLQWQQEAYVDIIKDLKDFSNYFDILKADNMISSSNYTGTKVVSSKENVLNASTLPGAVKGVYEVKIANLAESAKAKGTFTKLDGTSVSREAKLSDLGITSGDFKVTVKGKEFTVNIDETKSINDIVNDIKNVELDSGEILGSYINVSFSDLTKKLTIESKNTGKNETLKIEEGTSNFASKAGIQGDFIGVNAKASIKAPGEPDFVEVEKESNNFAIDGITYNLVKPTGEESIELNVTSDATASVDKFKKFVEKYNALVEKINGKINEKKEYKYTPLTEDQKKSMKDDEIKNWEEKAKQGTLRRDNNLTQLLGDLRSSLFKAVEGAGITMTELGISTTSNYMDGGKLQIDEKKLKDALENKGDMVQKLFTQSGTTTGTQGVFNRFKNILNENIGFDGNLIKKAGYKDTRWVGENDLSQKINTKNTLLKDLERKLFDKQESLYKRFAVLEKNINSLNSQSNWLYSQMGAS